MESATADRPATDAATGSKTLADLSRPPAKARPKRGGHLQGRRRRVGLEDLRRGREIVRKLSLGLIELGIEKGDKVAILSNTRPEWTYFDFAALSAGATVVPIYQTNSPEECQYVLENSDAVAVVVEDDEQLEKIRQVRDRCPALQHVIRMTGTSRDAISFDGLCERGDVGHRGGLGATLELGHHRRHLHLHLHLGHHRAAEGLRHLARQLPRDARHGPRGQRRSTTTSVTYLFLPLAHSFALLIQLGTFDLGATLAYWERDPLKILPNLAEVKPTYFPSVPRIFEKIYTAATSSVEKEGGLKKAVFDWAIGVGKKVRRLEREGKQPGPAARAPAPDRRQAGAVEDPRPVRRPA